MTGFSILESNEHIVPYYGTLLINSGFKLISSFVIVGDYPKVIVSLILLSKLHSGPVPNLVKDGSKIKSEQLSLDLSAKWLLKLIII